MAYVRPVRNRLPGLRGIRRGFGDLNCPGDPGCPGNPIPIGQTAAVTVTPTTTTIVTPQGTQTVPTANASAGGFSDWLNQNSSTVLWIAGVGLGVLLLSRMAR